MAFTWVFRIALIVGPGCHAARRDGSQKDRPFTGGTTMKSTLRVFFAITVLVLSANWIAAGEFIGISMPTQSLQRWNQDGANLKAKLEAIGYGVDLQYAGDNDIPNQVSQIENMISSGCKVLVIAAIDGTSLTRALREAKERNVKIIAYDRLIMNSDAVSYYATVDPVMVGVTQGEYLRDTLDLDNKPGPFHVELFAGDPADNNATVVFEGAMSVLRPYIASKKLIVPSGQISQAQVSTLNWNTEEAQKRMENLISAIGYGPNGTRLDGILSANDSIANGITNALISAGYRSGNGFPLLTGQDCDKPSVKNIIAGTQSMSVFKDLRTLADRVVQMVVSISKGEEVEVNDTTTYNNGTFIVPTYLCPTIICTKENYRELLIDSGYYNEADFK